MISERYLDAHVLQKKNKELKNNSAIRTSYVLVSYTRV